MKIFCWFPLETERRNESNSLSKRIEYRLLTDPSKSLSISKDIQMNPIRQPFDQGFSPRRISRSTVEHMSVMRRGDP